MAPSPSPRHRHPRRPSVVAHTLVASSSISAILLLFAFIIAPVDGFLGIGETRFKYEGLIDVGSLGLDNMAGMVAAVGDLDGEQFLELFVLSADQRSLSVYEWDRDAYTFRVTPNASVITSPYIITNVVPGDYDYDGRLDALLMGEDNPSGSSWWGVNSGELRMSYYRGLGHGSFETGKELPSSLTQQPMPIDADGDMRVDLLGFPYGDSKQQNLKVWKNVWQNTSGNTLFMLNDPPLDLADFSCQVPSPHSNAFIDLDGDCLADLFLVCQDPTDTQRFTYQIWINAKSSGFRLAQTGRLPVGIGQVTFADMDRDGTLDMVFPSCTSDGCYLNIAYNQQIPLCATQGGLTTSQQQKQQKSSSNGISCRETGNLCVADPQFTFDLSPGDTNSAFLRIAMSTLIPDAPFLILSDPSFRGNLPNPIRIGDYNKDGYPDLLIVSSSSSSARQGSVHILQSIPCSKKICSRAASAALRRGFSRLDGASANALNSITDAKSATWFDIDDDGTLDIMIQRSGRGSGASRSITFIKNNYYHDAFFLKTLFGNGACDGMCIGDNGTRYHPYGVSYSGATYKFTVLDTAGARKATQVAQLPQTGYLSLQTPYSYFGLGRTNNYVENLFVGSTRHQDDHFISMEGLIPNSQVVIVPYQPASVLDSSTWQKQLFLQPGKWIPWVGVALIASTIVLASIVLVLHVSELRQDEMERKNAQHLINFDAL